MALAAFALGASACGVLFGSPDDDPPAAPGPEDAGPEVLALDALASDASLDAGGDAPSPNVKTDASGPCVGCTRYVFVTSLATTGQIKGAGKTTLESADAFCQSEAAAASDTGMQNRKFRAWLSTGAGSPSTRFVHGTGPYVLPEAQGDSGPVVVARNWTELTGGTLLHAIDRDRDGTAFVFPQPVWTGTDRTGVSSDIDCVGWSLQDEVYEGRGGMTDATDQRWTDNASLGCDRFAHLYCFEE
jgi:hypothetical protein